ncbi:uncharacterized protein STEHIDRAFT_155334 [Stereum hirsutum FP-91666 SS1]|uniref:uncharacterized protein n=1 Tax=Stereum hirsutum (strain FP-91666) TaxID=721885 RepID=UPI000440BB2F|nr:uncharacterized protein STEHIDRAFT_155334 [Stereum hirsutum FP-91666 SS1]EIM87975.1 hypothetical protein STEHIDRAFT_155334 [Stereum hirsutum FP-91666 SS1]
MSAPDPWSTGPILAQGLLSIFVEGVLITQGAQYRRNTVDDTFRMKTYVISLVLLSLLQTAFIIYKMWMVLVLGENWSLDSLDWINLFLNGLLCFVAEISLIRRCWRVTKKALWLLVSMILLTTTTFAANIYLSTIIGISSRSKELTNDPLISTRSPATVAAFNYWIWSSFVLDGMITAILSYYLWKQKSGINHLDKCLKHIIGITWESAAVPSITMLIAVSLYYSNSNHNRHLVLSFILLTGKFYIIGIFRTLNSRSRIRRKMKNTDIGRTSVADEIDGDAPITGSDEELTRVEAGMGLDLSDEKKSSSESVKGGEEIEVERRPPSPVSSSRWNSAWSDEYTSSNTLRLST